MSEELCRTLFYNMAEACALNEIILDEKGDPRDYRFIEVNDAFGRLTGLMPERVRGRTIREARPAVKQHWIDVYGKVALTGEPVYFENFSPSVGKWFQVHAYSPRKGLFVTLFQDITERKRLEQVKDDFVGMVSHELRTPLTIISGCLSTVLSEWERLASAEMVQLLQDAVIETDSLSRLIENLLELSHFQARQLSLCAELTDIRKLIEGTLGKLRKYVSSHRFNASFPAGDFVVEADALRVERVLFNLLDNAVKNSPAGSRITIAVKPEPERLVISVKDQGRGLSPVEHERLFQPFERGADQTKRVRGAGLGLIVCQRLVEAHGGKIWVESCQGQGATFFFSLPKRE